MTGKTAFDKIAEIRDELKKLALDIWNNPELPWHEYKASAWTADMLEKYGFNVERGYKGLKTAVHATWGEGYPHIGFFGEYDALPGMSQEVSPVRKAIVEGGPGHGCGHNLLGTACVGAAIGLKEEMEKTGVKGTIHFYGCPAEEDGSPGKTFLVREGAFKELDSAIFWHPSSGNAATLGRMTATNNIDFIFRGRTSHAAVAPQHGRSALDAVELMNVGANYLREHLNEDVRMHYIITDGGAAANIVPDYASSHYTIRSVSREYLSEVYDRLCKVAQGAATMTETEVEIIYTGGCYNTLNMRTLAEVAQRSLDAAPFEEWSEEDKAFAEALNMSEPGTYQAAIRRQGFTPGQHLAVGQGPMRTKDGGGSSDVGDVGNMIPGVNIGAATAPLAAMPHLWQFTAASGHEIGIKGMIYAAKVMAHFGLELMHDTSIIDRAKEEFAIARAGLTYMNTCPDNMPIPE